MNKNITITVHADADQDDCLAAAASEYIAKHPALRGWDLAPRWTDENERETVALSVPRWFYEQLSNTSGT